MNDRKTILVTGGSGYVAGWIIARLLDAGYAVRGTLRDTSRSAAIRADIATATKDLAALDFVRADLLADLGWDAAMRGVAAVMHVASPVMARRKEDTIGIAVEGTRRVLAAAARAGVDRVIITSSAAAARIGEAASGPADEQVWTDATAPHIGVYAQSKTLAEQAGWEFARQHPDGPRVATILPAFVQGPLLGRNASASLDVVGRMLQGKLPAVPRLGFSIVDVRDLAELHLKVLDDPQGPGERWIASAAFMWLSDIASLLHNHFGAAASKAPRRVAPDWLFRLIALADANMKPMVPDLGERRTFSSRKAEERLGWHPRPARDAVIATAESLLARDR
jgi:dihydroflavonol-4-reductase